MHSNEELAELYDYLYKTPEANGSLYGFMNRRAGFFVKYIREHIEKKSSVLEVGCGRGQLLRWLRMLEYDVLGTEIADCLLEDDLCGLPVKKMFCSDLHTIGDEEFDCVISNDVLEHLSNEQAVIDAFSECVIISKKHIVMSTGGIKAARSLRGQIHNIIKPAEWWMNLFENYCVVTETFIATGSLFIFGEKK